MKLRKNIHRLLAIVLALNLSLGLVNVTALAADQPEGAERTLVCGKEEHTHDATCYTGPVLVCGQAESEGHTHTDACYREVEELICGQDESEPTEGHTHTDECYTDELICGLEETEGSEAHTHSDACYDEAGELICELEESEPVEGHVHGEDCYARKLICTLPEGEGSEGHTHTPECYKTTTELVCGQEESAGHVHTSECYETFCGKAEHPTENCEIDDAGNFLCGHTEEHQHSDECYKHLTCGKEEHTHTDECYAAQEPQEKTDCEDGHTWDAETGKCSVCGTECAHEAYTEDGVCETCGMKKEEPEVDAVQEFLDAVAALKTAIDEASTTAPAESAPASPGMFEEPSFDGQITEPAQTEVTMSAEDLEALKTQAAEVQAMYEALSGEALRDENVIEGFAQLGELNTILANAKTATIAATNVASVKVGTKTTNYPTIDEAVAYANENSGSTVTLQTPEVNVTNTEGVLNVTATMTINLNGKTLTGNIIVDNGGDLNLKIGGGDSQKMNGAITVKTGGNLTLEDNSSSTTGFRYPYKVTLYEGACVSMATRPSNNRAPYINLTIEENAWEKYSKAGLHDILPSWVLVKNVSGNITITNMPKASMQTDNLEPANLSKVYDAASHTVSLVKENSDDVPDVPGVFLSGSGTEDADGKYTSPVSSFEKAKELLANSEDKTIYVTETVKVTGEETWSLADIPGAKITRFPGIAEDHSDAFTGDLVEVTKDGSLTLENITLDGGSLVDVNDDVEVKEPALVVMGALVKVSGGKLTLNDGAVLQNNVKNGKEGNNAWGAKVVGAGVFADDNAYVEMNDGAKIASNTASHGGGIGLYHGSTFTMNGGEISGNKASDVPANRGKKRPETTNEFNMGYWTKVSGGGVFLAYSSTFNLNGGTIRENQSDYFGGGVAVGGDNSTIVLPEYTTTMSMGGGKVTLNTSKNVGGGIFVETGCKATITKGDITFNKSLGGLYGGGGIYVNGGDMGDVPNGQLQLYNVEIARNSSISKDEGSAVAGCPSSNVKIYLTDGAVIYDNYIGEGSNHSPSRTDVFVSAVPAGVHTGEPEVVISDFMLGGGRYHWKDQYGEPYELNDNGLLELHYSYQSFLKTDATRNDFDVTAGVSQATVHIQDNTARYRGGGIGANGDIIIGKEDKSGLWLEKRLDGEGARNHTDDTFKFEVQFKDFIGTVHVTKDGGNFNEDVELTDGSYTVELKAGEGVFLSGIPEGTEYTVTETNTSKADGTKVQYTDYTSRIVQQLESDYQSSDVRYADRATYGSITDKSTTASGHILPPGYAAVAIFTNTFDAGKLAVTKTVAGDTGDTNKDWNFTVELSGEGSNITGKFGDMEFTNGVAEFTLKHGETKTAEQLPYGITYTVTEAEADQGGYTTTYTDDTGKIEKNQTATATFTNTHAGNGDLVVTKTVTGTAGDTSKEWNFTVELSDKTITGTYGDMEFAEGVANFTLKHGESKTAKGLPVGTTYTVTEAEAGQDGYSTSSTGDTGKIVKDEPSTAVFTNSKDNPPPPPSDPTGSLTIQKAIVGGGTEATEKTYTFTVAGPNGYSETVEITGAGSVTLSGLILGTYTITETGADIDGWDLTVSGDTEVTLKAGKNDATITNTYTEQVGSLQISKELAGGGTAAAEKVFTFDVTGPDGYNETVEITGAGTATLNNLKHGEYTVTERDAQIDGYTWSVQSDGSATVEKGGQSSVTVTNTYTEIKGSLQITKNIVGGGTAAAEKVYSFDVTGPNGYSEIVTVTGAGTATLEDLEPGEYTITEQDAEIQGYTLEVTGDTTATVTDDGNTAQATVTNTYTPSEGALTITKRIGGGGTTAATKVYTFIVTGPDGYRQTVTITGSDTVTLEGLVPGTYTITEADASIAGLTWSVYGVGAVTVNAGETTDATITNVYTPPEEPDNPPPENPPEEPDNPPENPPETDIPNIPPPQTDIPETPTPDIDIPDDTPPQTDIPETPTPETDIPDNPPPETDIPDEQPPQTDIPDEEPPMTEIPDEEPPLTEIPDEEPPLTEIPDEDVPMDDVPQTGDKSKKGLWILMALFSALGMVFSLWKDRKEEDQ